MKFLSKAGLMVATAATLVATAAPAEAQRRYNRYNDRVDAGDVIAGALIIGGIAAIASASSNNRYNRGYRGGYGGNYGYNGGYGGNYGYNDGNDGYGYYDNGYNGRQGVEQCVRAAQREANRYGGFARVTDVTAINRIRGGYEVRGRVVVQDRNGGYRNNWDRGYNYDRYNDGYDRGRFSCVTRNGRVQDVRLSGLRYG